MPFIVRNTENKMCSAQETTKNGFCSKALKHAIMAKIEHMPGSMRASKNVKTMKASKAVKTMRAMKGVKTMRAMQSAKGSHHWSLNSGWSLFDLNF